MFRLPESISWTNQFNALLPCQPNDFGQLRELGQSDDLKYWLSQDYLKLLGLLWDWDREFNSEDFNFKIDDLSSAEL